MIFTVFGIIAILIISVASTLFRKLKLRGKITKRIKWAYIASVAIILILVFNLLKFLCSLLVFDSTEQSVKVTSCNSVAIDEQVDVEGGAFLICNNVGLFGKSDSSTEIHSILKRGDSWSYLDVNNSYGGFIILNDASLGSNQFVTDDGKRGMASGLYMYNSEMDKTMLYLNFMVSSYIKDASDFVVQDKEGNEFCFYEDSNSSVDAGKSYLVVDGEIDNDYKIYINGTEIDIDLATISNCNCGN